MATDNRSGCVWTELFAVDLSSQTRLPLVRKSLQPFPHLSHHSSRPKQCHLSPHCMDEVLERKLHPSGYFPGQPAVEKCFSRGLAWGGFPEAPSNPNDCCDLQGPLWSNPYYPCTGQPRPSTPDVSHQCYHRFGKAHKNMYKLGKEVTFNYTLLYCCCYFLLLRHPR